jgi:diacylglycerol kinase (ATP)
MIIRNEQQNSFSMRARLKSFRYALEGLTSFFASQHNAIIHLFVTVFVFIAAIFFHVAKGEMIAIILATAFVWSAELFNTAIEKLCDMASKDFHPAIKFIKDISAAAVFLSAVAAFLTGLIIFLPKIVS